jgi:dTDP-L-rhamnose 4-epimerase
MQEQMLRQLAIGAGWDVGVLRFQNVYGPGQSLRNPYTGVLSLFTRRLLANATVDVFEDGEITRDFVFQPDVVEALLLAGWAEGIGDQPINIGSGVGTTILEAAHRLAEAAGRPAGLVRITGDFRVGDIRHAVADIRRAEALLGWRPHVDFATGAAALVEWARREQAAR